LLEIPHLRYFVLDRPYVKNVKAEEIRGWVGRRIYPSLRAAHTPPKRSQRSSTSNPLQQSMKKHQKLISPDKTTSGKASKDIEQLESLLDDVGFEFTDFNDLKEEQLIAKISELKSQKHEYFSLFKKLINDAEKRRTVAAAAAPTSPKPNAGQLKKSTSEQSLLSPGFNKSEALFSVGTSTTSVVGTGSAQPPVGKSSSPALDTKDIPSRPYTSLGKSATSPSLERKDSVRGVSPVISVSTEGPTPTIGYLPPAPEVPLGPLERRSSSNVGQSPRPKPLSHPGPMGGGYSGRPYPLPRQTYDRYYEEGGYPAPPPRHDYPPPRDNYRPEYSRPPHDYGRGPEYRPHSDYRPYRPRKFVMFYKLTCSTYLLW
jgi:hypothetical protein